MYQFLVFIHMLGVFGFLVSHGVAVGVLFRLRAERDPERINGLLQASTSSIQTFYVSLGLLLVGGILAAFKGGLWASGGWLWGAIGVLILTSLAMYRMATPYYRRVRLVARALAGGSKAVTDEQFAGILTSRRPLSVAVTGFVGLLVILYFMVFKPSLGLGGSPPTPPVLGPSVAVAAEPTGLAFDTKALTAPAGTAFTLVFDNRTPGTPHNVAIYQDSSALKNLFRGAIFNGPKIVQYQVPALPAGTYFFRCDVHTPMSGTFLVRSGAGSPSPTGA